MILASMSYNELDKIQSVSAKTDHQHILVIDAGHGGDDGGAVSQSGVQEADLNLDIALKLDTLCALCGVPTIMTRSAAEITYPDDATSIAARKVADQKQRVALINNTKNATLVSIHQNEYPTSQPHGAQVLYGNDDTSKALGEQMQMQLVTHLDPQNRRVAAPISKDIYLMKNIRCPGVLIECGFLSNPDECARLQTRDYQIEITMTILSSYLQNMQNGCFS